MAMWRVVAQQETRDGRWSGSVQLPTFYVEAGLLSEVITKAVDVLWDGRQAGAPVHLSVLKMCDDLSDLPGSTVRTFTVLRDGDAFPDGSRVLYKRVGASLQEVIEEKTA